MFEKIKNIFRKIFKKQKLLEEPKMISQIKINKFKEELNKSTEIYNIQKLYEDGKIDENELQINQIRKLIDLYKKQIRVLDNDINIKRAKYDKESI